MDISYKTSVFLIILTAQALSFVPANLVLSNLKCRGPAKSIELVRLNVTVTNKADHSDGLKPGDFVISIDKTAAPIVSFGKVDSPLSVGILFDSSIDGESSERRPRKISLLCERIRHFLS